VAKTAARATVLPTKPLKAVRHLNLPALGHVGVIGVGLVVDRYRGRCAEAPSWSDLVRTDRDEQ
jgi:hypothetical protein